PSFPTRRSSDLIPNDAVVRRDGRAYVFIVEGDNRVREQGIEVGPTHGDRIEVRSGLPADARVVASGAGFLGDGDLVRVVEAAAEAATSQPSPASAQGRADAGNAAAAPAADGDAADAATDAPAVIP